MKPIVKSRFRRRRFRIERRSFQIEGRGLRIERRSFQIECRRLRIEGRSFQIEGRKFRIERRSFQIERRSSGLKDSGSASQVCNLSLLFIALTIIKVLVEIFAQQSSCDVMEMVTQWSYFLAVPTGPAHKVTTVSIKEKYMFK